MLFKMDLKKTIQNILNKIKQLFKRKPSNKKNDHSDKNDIVKKNTTDESKVAGTSKKK